MEGNPHGSAHTSFFGFISAVPTAAQDPLFFLLHANIDRLWAKWQFANGQAASQRFDTTNPATYEFLGSAGGPNAERIGHNLNDTMWPWNHVTGTGLPGDRPPTAPGGDLAGSPAVAAPGPSPTVRDMVDYQGLLTPGDCLGYGYDDVPFK
jgi:tyrosinase